MPHVIYFNLMAVTLGCHPPCNSCWRNRMNNHAQRVFPSKIWLRWRWLIQYRRFQCSVQRGQMVNWWESSWCLCKDKIIADRRDACSCSVKGHNHWVLETHYITAPGCRFQFVNKWWLVIWWSLPAALQTPMGPPNSIPNSGPDLQSFPSLRTNWLRGCTCRTPRGRTCCSCTCTGRLPANIIVLLSPGL